MTRGASTGLRVDPRPAQTARQRYDLPFERRHWLRDLTFGEDRSRLHSGSAPQIMAAFRNLVLTLIRRTGTTEIAAFRQHVRSRPTKTLRFLVPRTRFA